MVGKELIVISKPQGRSKGNHLATKYFLGQFILALKAVHTRPMEKTETESGNLCRPILSSQALVIYIRGTIYPLPGV